MMRRIPSTPTTARGFTLIEVMITVAIVAILASIALPSYQEHVRKAKRAEAQSILLEAAQYMQRYYSGNDRYTATQGSVTTEAVQTLGDDSLLPAPLRQSPKTGGGSANYTIAVLARDVPPTFTLKATRAGTMTGDKCGTLTLTGQGVRGLQDQNTGLTTADCWK